ncbi:MAG: hypothetical protein OXC44_05485 [Proteobacteria bacterium]|nr:hypothetical protein [Pseudomonadota bacterium]
MFYRLYHHLLFWLVVCFAGLWIACGGNIEKGDFDVPYHKPYISPSSKAKKAKKKKSASKSSSSSKKAKAKAKTAGSKNSSQGTDLLSMIGKGVKVGKLGKRLANSGMSQFGNFGSCIVGKPPQASQFHGSDYTPDGQIVRFSHKRIESTSDLKHSIKAKGKVSMGYQEMIGNATTEYLSNHSISQKNRYYFYLIEVENPKMVMSDIRLSLGAYDLYREKGEEAFYKRCGKEALIGHKTGGYLLNIIQISKKVQTSATSIDHLISASGFGFGLDGMLTIKDSSDLSELDVSIFTRWYGGKGGQTYSTLNELRDMSSQWPAMVAKHGVTIDNIYMSYDTLMDSIEDPYYDIIRSERDAYIKQLSRLYRLRQVLMHQESQPPKHDPQLHIPKIEKLIEQLAAQLKICNKSLNIASCQNSNLLMSAQKYRIRSVRPHPTCGVRSTIPVFKRHRFCGKEDYTVKEVRRDPRCQVERYEKGAIFEKEILFKSPLRDNYKESSLYRYYPKECFLREAERRIAPLGTKEVLMPPKRPCVPMNDDCLFEKPRYDTQYVYLVSCHKEAPQFGVAVYQPCEVDVTKQRDKECYVSSGRVKEFFSCEVDLEL